MAEKKKAGVRVEPPEQSEQVQETVQAPMTEATVAPEPRYSLQARVDRLVDKPDGKLRAILSMNLPGGFAVHGIKIYENDGGLFVSMPQSSYTAADGTIKYLIPAKLTANGADANGILESLTVGKKAISVTLGSFAQGLSGKLETGDIVSVIVYRAKEGAAVTPPELQYLRVITSTTSQGVDKANITDSTQPVTVTLLVNQAQAELLSAYEKSASMHFALEYRGDAETAAQYLAVQEEYFRNGGSHE